MLSILVVPVVILSVLAEEHVLPNVAKHLESLVALLGHRVWWTGFAVHLAFELLELINVLEASHALKVSLLMLDVSTCVLELALRNLRRHAKEAPEDTPENP